MKTENLSQLLRDRADKRIVVTATDLGSGKEQLIYPADNGAGDELTKAARTATRADKSRIHEMSDGRRIFLHVHNPPLRMMIVGAVHIAQPLSRMAVLAGYEVTVIEPRRAFASEDRFPGVYLNGDWADDALDELKPDRRTAIVTLTHDPKLDDPGLSVAIRSDAFYVGALGSRGTHAKRVARLKEDGFADSEIDRIHAPVGLAIGAKSPAEISVSILAEITDVLHAREKKAAA